MLNGRQIKALIDLNIRKLLIFLEIVRDDLKQVKSDVRNMSEKLETLKSTETGDKGQFQGTNS